MTTLLYGEPHLGDSARNTTLIASGAGAASSSIASGGVVSAALLKAGIASQTVPVVGTVLGAVALIGAGIAKLLGGRKAAKALDKQRGQVNAALAAIVAANVEADKQIVLAETELAKVQAQLKQYGLSGLGCLCDQPQLGSWFQRTFTPKKNAKKNLDKAVKRYNKLFPEYEADLNEKITYLESLQTQLKQVQAKLTGAKTVTQAGGYALAIAAVLLIGGALLKKLKSKAK